MLYIEDVLTECGSLDINTATYNSLGFFTDMYEFNINIIEKPSFITIDNQKTGTYLITLEEKFEKYRLKFAYQVWLTFGKDHSNSFEYIGLSNFDDPEEIEIRDHIIKFIDFINTEQINKNNIPSDK